MPVNARFVHTNIVARDWKRLAEFYQQVFDCKPVPPERNFREKWIADVTAVPRAEIQGMHLRLPGYGDEGPTLEIFQYSIEKESAGTAINRPGLAHIAFAVDDVKSAREAVIATGGGTVGDLVTVDIADAGRITFVYLSDPEGNIIELQKWH